VILYFMFLFLVPFQEHPILGAPLFTVGQIPITLIKVVGVPLVAAALLLPRPRDAAPRPGPTILLLFAAFALYQIIGTFLSSLSFPATDLSTLFAFAILIFATSLLICTRNRMQMTIRTIVLVETFASTWLYKQYYIYHWPRPIGPSNDPNYEALSLVIALPLALWLARHEVRYFWKWVGLVCSPILAFAVFVSQSRGALLALTVMAALAWMNSRHKMRLALGFAAAAALMLAIAPSQMIQRIEQTQLRGQATTGAGESTRERVELTRAGLHMMEAHPVFGIGLGQFKAVEFHYNRTLEDLEPDPKVAHNTYAQLGAEGGVPTLALYLAILAVTLATSRRAQKLPGVPEDISALALSFQIGLIGIMVAEFFLTAQYIKGVWVFISLAPNLYTISVQLAAVSMKTAPAEPEPVGPILLRPRLRTG
jgi:O-antigen ligase